LSKIARFFLALSLDPRQLGASPHTSRTLLPDPQYNSPRWKIHKSSKIARFLGSFLRPPAAGSSALKPLGFCPRTPSTTLPVEKDTNRQKSLGYFWSSIRPPTAGSSAPKPRDLCPRTSSQLSPVKKIQIVKKSLGFWALSLDSQRLGAQPPKPLGLCSRTSPRSKRHKSSKIARLFLFFH